MANIFEVQFSLTGWSGGPGLNTWFFTSGQVDTQSTDAEHAATEVAIFYTAIRPYLHVGYRATATGEAKVYDIASGDLVDVLSYDAPDDVVGSDTITNTSRATMAKLRVRTATIVNNRRLAGGVYIGPISDAAINSDGTIQSAFTTAASNGLASSISGIGPKLQVWHRPKGNPPGGGVAGDVVTVGVKGVPAVLRRRRD